MSKNELKETFKECNLNVNHDFDEQKSLGEIGLDSLDIMMLSFEISDKTGNEIKFMSSTTIGDILGMA